MITTIRAIRLFLYLVLSRIYWVFMTTHAPLGIAWRPFHEQRVFNAVNHMVNGSPLIGYGFTSWNDFHEVVVNSSAGNPIEAYVVSPLPHLLQAALVSINPEINLSYIGSLGDFFLICCVAALTAEILLRIINPFNITLTLLWPVSAFALFLASPWSYRMMLAPWHEVSWLLCYSLAILFFLLDRRTLGLFALLIAGFYHWQWSLLLFIFYGLVYVMDLVISSKSIPYLLPPGLRSRQGAHLVMAMTITPAFCIQVQSLLASYSKLGIKHTGSNLLFRIGIDAYSNIHHGGILAAMQFLGGNRISECLTSPNMLALNTNIKVFNCILSIFSVVSLSLIAIIGYIWLCSAEKRHRWLTLPTMWCFASFGLVFQQSYAVHLQGYSFVFAFIFTLGIVYLLHKSFSAIRFPPQLIILFSIPLVTGILINFVRVSYLTDTYG